MKINLSKFSKPIILVVFMLVLTILRPNSFPTIGNLSNVLWSISVYGIMVCGTIFVFLIGGIDLSIGSLCGLCAVTVVMIIRSFDYSNTGVILGILAALGVGIAAGLFHGIIITTFHVPAFLITFATQTIFLGMSMILTNNKILSCLQPELFTAIGMKKIFSFPIPIYIMIIIAAISWFLLSKTEIGRYTYAVGGNASASRLSGISDKGITIMAYVFSGFTTAIGGIVLASMTQQCMASTGSGYETEVITAAVIGGVSLLGGEGTVSGALFGAILIGLLNNGLNLMSVPSTEHGLVKGIVIIAAVAFDALQHQDKFKAWLNKFKVKKDTATA
ncbi:MAG: ABC transporter permease [Eubacteriales bacterium]|nr:ABC transporter permease [Eubacteriales bacterium]